jgi:hypothetical protein
MSGAALAAAALTAPALMTLALMAPAAARPVSWPGGTTLIQELDPGTASVLLHYTPHRSYSVGGRYERARDPGWQIAGPQATWLVRRWNRPAAQANIYLSGMAGAAWRDGRAARPGGMAQAQADWENRRVMVMGLARVTHAEGIGTHDMQMARIGWAPYAGNYGDVHLWLFAQAKRDTAMADPRIAPALVARAFYRTMMVEAGVTDRGGLILNTQFRF